MACYRKTCKQEFPLLRMSGWQMSVYFLNLRKQPWVSLPCTPVQLSDVDGGVVACRSTPYIKGVVRVCSGVGG